MLLGGQAEGEFCSKLHHRCALGGWFTPQPPVLKLWAQRRRSQEKIDFLSGFGYNVNVIRREDWLC